MKRVFGLVFLFIAFLVLASCGETVVVDEVIKEEVSKEVSAGEGGTVSNSDDSVKMTIPADALDGDTRITMTIYESSRYDFGTGEEVATKVIECEPSGTVFKKPIMITMTNKRDIRNKLITAAVFNEEKGEWSYSPTGAAVKISGYNEAGDPIMTTAAGDPIMLSAAGDPIMMSAAGDPIMLASAGDPIMVTAAGDPIMNSAAGDPIMMTTGHFTTYTFIALGDDWEPRDSGDEGDDDEDDDTDGEPYVPECGNGITDEGEECDHGEDNSDESGVVNSTCRKDCTFARCGDGIKDADEGCDDGNNEDGDYCSADCQTETGSCGDGEIQGNEACDDGNTADGDYCSADCKTLTGKCGDGEIQGNEECDNGETGENYNGKTTCTYGEKSCTVCTASCKKAEGVASYCGDGVTDPENNEACDNASDNGRTACAYGETSCTLCTAECQTAAGTTSFCGDGSTDTAHGEACDNASDNGRTACAYGETSCTVCTTNCQTKAGKTSYCGDGIKDASNGEVCDKASDNGRTACAYGEKSCTVCTVNCQSASGTTSFCGDGEIQGGEACDNGSDNGRTACAYGETSCTLCTTSCQTAAGTTSFCGDGIKDASHGEACDNGAENGKTACAYGETNCTLCTVNCQTAAGTVSYCGDGIVDEASGEVCDDGNAADGDYCSSDCREITGFCGDGIVQGNEACDKADPDAEVIGSDFVSDALSEGTGGYCSDDCHEVTGTCGDGIIQREDCEGYENCAELAGINEACDNGAENGRTACAYGEEGCDLCTSECQIMKGEASYCGDGIIDETNNEACDNGSDNGRTDCAYGETSCTVCTTACRQIQGATSYCGDGRVDSDNNETCDEGSLNGTYGHCNATCSEAASRCGDGVLDSDSGEECDDGELNGTYNHCNSTCSGRAAYCGDGNIDEGHETCDNGAKNGETTCAYGATSCTVCTTECHENQGVTSFCGDGTKDEANGEQCDNGELNGRTNCAYGETSCTVCTAQCLEIGGPASYCGDGMVDSENNETCDEGSLNGTYGHCNAACSGRASFCGDGVLDSESGEQCDDGSLNGTYNHCNETCSGAAAYCGDGRVDEDHEACDNGAKNGETKCAYGATECHVCTTSCGLTAGETSYCGDGTKDEANGEQCDNGSDNGRTDCAYGETSCTVCTAQCLEIGGSTSYCGDGRVDSENNETCDEGSLNGTYGHCNATCSGEASHCGDGTVDTENGEACDDGELNGSYGKCNETCNGRAPYCGDGNIDEDHEACDNGAKNGETKCAYGEQECTLCTTSCQPVSGETSFCGDNNIDVENGEACDSGELNGMMECTYGETECQRCSAACQNEAGNTSYCGDGRVDEDHEGCDNGAKNGETKCAYGEQECTLCSAQCQPANGETSFCGDGTKDEANGEQCDNGSDNGRTNCAYGETSCTVCTTGCLEIGGAASYCGDGKVDTENNETCDEGSLNGTYGHCNATCSGEASRCGDGNVDTENGETCDDGELNGTYNHCNETCSAQTAYCGDGNVNEGYEACDNGSANGETKCAYGATECQVCTTSCQPVSGETSYCGDNNIDVENGEACDSGELNGMMECTYGETECQRCAADCQFADGVASYCGDGEVQSNEACDHGFNNGVTDCLYGETSCALCSETCQNVQGAVSYCGDAVKDEANGEQCDNGDLNGQTDCAYGETSCTVCTTGCLEIGGAASYCGDGRIDAENNETCDEGSLNGTYGHCNATCSGEASRCGDGILDSDSGEQCDDGELNGTYNHCNETCNGRAAYCGDGNIDEENDEGCDNGAKNGETKCAYGEQECIVCTTSCQPVQGETSFCGDNNIDVENSEACDSGELNGMMECTYGETECQRCSETCQNEAGNTSFCGDGRVDEDHEACDNGAKNGETKCAYGDHECTLCSAACQPANGETSFCGDAVKDEANGEQCDNGSDNGRTDCAYGETSCTVCTTGCLEIGGAASFCGDGKVDAENNETCDEGSLNGTYGHCNATCSGEASHCGDGNIDTENGETCDDGELNGSYGKCNATCNGRAAYCGDGNIDEENDEACDNGAANGETKCAYGATECQVCTTSCQPVNGETSYCGDAVKDEANGEQCDNGELNGQTNCAYGETECTVCTEQCREISGAASYCGDGRVDEDHETCDEGSLNGTYGHCNATCSALSAHCGDGNVDTENGETCDEGEANGTYDHCNSTCSGQAAHCGDGNIDEGHETCDNGAKNGETKCAYGEQECTLCSTQCQPVTGETSFCGDAVKDEANGEQCDNGELNGATDCAYGETSCTVCTTGCLEIGGAASYCGDGKVDAENNETCDEGSLNGTYGHCNATCSGEAAHCGDGNIDSENGETCDEGELNGSYSHCNETCSGLAAHCGDGNIDSENGEACDNGAANGETKCAYGDHECTLCTTQCQPANGETSFCGDNNIDVENGEACDSGELNGMMECTYGETECQRCSANCQNEAGNTSFCGDGNIDEGHETCDNGELNGQTNCAYGEHECTLCTADCQPANGETSFCGDGIKDAANGEQCDNGEDNGATDCAYGETSCTLCTTSCLPVQGAVSYCGDGRIDETNNETCDEGANLNGTYGHCNATCSGEAAHCGDGNIDSSYGETCDDGELNGSYGKCNETCNGRAPYCGDGNIDEGHETCDNGAENGATNCAYGEHGCTLCTADCQPVQGETSFCGDGHVDAANGEQCDSGEDNGLTDCAYGETSCTLCTTSCLPVQGVVSYCGDGRVDAENNETCDEGANLNGTYGHCNATCNGAAAHCGDGNIDTANGETCDDGELNGSYEHCNETCNGRAPYCGDGNIDEGHEGCDNGDANGTTNCAYGEEECIVCTSQCQPESGITSFCGDENIDTANGEQCDNGSDNGATECAYNETECTVCTAQCREIPGAASFCGDGQVDAANEEECDKGFGNGITECAYGEEECIVCTSDCHEDNGNTSFCGDGHADAANGEQCDNGELNGATECEYGETSCTLCTEQCRQMNGAASFCGDGRVDEENGEACDDGANLNGTYGHCNATCSALSAHCGDGNIDSSNGETCDDGELNGTYGKCNATCSGDASHCGDGVVDADNEEECDRAFNNGATSCLYGEEECIVCTSDCKEDDGIASYCGDGEIDESNGEQCDSGEDNGQTDCEYNEEECTVCTAQCREIPGATSFCGDGRIDEENGEECDRSFENGTTDCDYGQTECTVCDEGCNVVEGIVSYCGDSVVDAANGEQCDSGELNGQTTNCAYGETECTLCTAQCRPVQGIVSYCGDGRVDAENGEACDNAEPEAGAGEGIGWRCSDDCTELNRKVLCTGQTKCSDGTSVIDCPAEGEPFYGQDGQYAGKKACQPSRLSKGEPIEINADTTYDQVIDETTGLRWLVVPADATYDHASAKAFCENQEGYGGYQWRLPSVKELNTIMHGDDDLVRKAYFNYGEEAEKSYVFWTDTRESYAYAALRLNNPTPEQIEEARDEIYVVDFEHMMVLTNGNSESNQDLVICVSGDEYGATGEYTVTSVNGDEVVSDSSTNLLWQKSFVNAKTPEQAFEYCENLEYAGYTDWRLPNKNEMMSLADYDSTGESLTSFPGFADGIDDGMYSSMGMQLFWTSTSALNKNTSYGFIVFEMVSGMILPSAEGGISVAAVRCVRSTTVPYPEGKSMPYCNESGYTPCEDASTGIVWSQVVPAQGTISTYQDVANLCSDSTDGGIMQWRLPTVSELRTILSNSDALKTGGTCGVTDECTTGDCYDEEACAGAAFESMFHDTGLMFTSTFGDEGNREGYWTVYPVEGLLGLVSSEEMEYIEYFPLSIRCVKDETLPIPVGTYTDQNTGLTWSKVKGSLSRVNAVKYCKNLVEGGYDNWRIPTIDELGTLVQNCPEGGCEAKHDGSYSVLNESRKLWSSTITTVEEAQAMNFFDFSTASQITVTEDLDTYSASLRCVRSDNDPAAPVIEYPYINEGIVWSEKSGAISSLDDAEADYCAALSQANYGGYSEWSLPSLEEYATILDCESGREKLLGTIGETSFGGCEEISFSGSRSTVFDDSEVLVSSSSYARYPVTVDFTTGGLGVVLVDGGSLFYYTGGESFVPAPDLYVRCVAFADACEASPCEEIANSNGDCTSSRGVFTCGCYEGYTWDGSACVALSWSSLAGDTMSWNDAVSYCENLEEGGYDDWRLPDINELRTVIQNCEATQTGGTCTVSDPNHLSYSEGDGCSCEAVNDTAGYYSRLGDGDVTLWSSSVMTEMDSYAWYAGFLQADAGYQNKNSSLNVRCVRSGAEGVPELMTVCTDLPENAKWVSTVTAQTWNGESWVPAAVPVYGEEESSTECRFRCAEDYVWDGEACVDPERETACADLPEGALWNGSGKITQNWNGESWVPEVPAAFYSEVEIAEQCTFRCYHTSTWTGSICESNLSVDNSVEGSPVVVDSATGLRWQHTLPDDMTWAEAVAYCENLEYAGISGWRLPNPQELLGISDSDPAYFGESGYWSDKEYDTREAFYGWESSISRKNKNRDNPTMCVYGDEILPPSFIETESAGDALVLDSNGIMWQKTYAGERSYGDAVSYCENLEYAGYGNWRLPDHYEAAALVNYDKGSSPYTDFPGDMPDYPVFWADGGYIVYFNYGVIITSETSDDAIYYVRCVREVQPSDQFNGAACTGLPENAEWNTVSGLSGTWNGMNWPVAAGVYNTEASTTECRFKCRDHYTWDDGSCTLLPLGNICTGMTQCYVSSGYSAGTGTSCMAAGDPYAGQDAYYAAMEMCVPKNLSAEGDIVVDHNTGLQWQRSISTTKYSWDDAVAYCGNLTAGGYDDWRLAAPDEIQTVTGSNYGNFVGGFQNAPGGQHNIWLNRENPENTDKAFAFNYTGTMDYDAKTNENFAVCVRGRTLPKPSFEIAQLDEAEVVTDLTTGLVWQPDYVTNKNWTEALEYCENLEYAGYDDWRLPNKHEMMSLMDFDKATTPFNDFPNVLTGRFHTSTHIGGGRVFDLNLSNGVRVIPTCGETRNVICVRSDIVGNPTRQAACLGLPEGAEWNTATSIEQTWDGSQWVGSVSRDGVYNEEPSTEECRYKCKENYTWSNASASCVADTQEEIECSDIPANAEWWNGTGTITQTWSGTEWLPSSTSSYSESVTPSEDCSFKCLDGYFWDGEACQLRPTLGNICTGQTLCYDASLSIITCPTSESADFFGQDAQYAALGKCTAQSFTAGTGAQSGTVIDNNTGLIWEQSPSENTYTWDNAQNHCADLNSSNYGGKSNWRVPNPLEFMTIVDNSTYEPATNSNFTGMPADDGVYIWTSAEYKGNTSYAYAFKPYYGNYYGSGSSSSKTKTYKVLCVSGDEMQPATSADFTTQTISGKVVVTDSKTGLMWQNEYETGKTWQEALSYCEDSTYAGYSDWRMPNKNELASLVNYEKSGEPYSYFPDMPSDHFWSSSTYVDFTNSAWIVYFGYDAYVDAITKTYNYGYVRCVR